MRRGDTAGDTASPPVGCLIGGWRSSGPRPPAPSPLPVPCPAPTGTGRRKRSWLAVPSVGPRRFVGQELGPGEQRLLPFGGFLVLAVAVAPVSGRGKAVVRPVAGRGGRCLRTNSSVGTGASWWPLRVPVDVDFHRHRLKFRLDVPPPASRRPPGTPRRRPRRPGPGRRPLPGSRCPPGRPR